MSGRQPDRRPRRRPCRVEGRAWWVSGSAATRTRGPKDGGGEPLAAEGVDDLADAITESFGSFAGFKAQPTKAAATTQGSGWGIRAYEPISGRLIVEQVYDHQGNVGQGSTPILVFDAWEHAFCLQYKNQKVDFIDAMWAVVNWQDVARCYAAAQERGNSLLLAP